MKKLRKIIILGGNGYIAKSICKYLNNLSDYHIFLVVRTKPSHHYYDQYIISDINSPSWIEDVININPDAIINCAFDFKKLSKNINHIDEKKYFELSHNLKEIKRRCSPLLINISSTSAFINCKTIYGNEKLKIEEIFSLLNGVNIRPGLVVSFEDPGSAFKKLIDLIIKLRILPYMSRKNSGFYICNQKILLHSIYLILNYKINKAHTISLCFDKKMQMIDIIKIIKNKYNIKSVHIKFPWFVLYYLLLFKEFICGYSKVRSDSILDYAYSIENPDNIYFYRFVLKKYLNISMINKNQDINKYKFEHYFFD